MVVVDALEGEAADELEAHAAVAVDKLVDIVVAVDKLKDGVVAVDELEDVVVAVDELKEGVVVAVDELEVVEGGAVREPCFGAGEVGRVELTVAAAYVTGDRLSFSFSKKHSVSSFWLTLFSIGRHSARAPWESEVMGRARYSSSAFSAKSSTSVVPCGVSLS